MPHGHWNILTLPWFSGWDRGIDVDSPPSTNWTSAPMEKKNQKKLSPWRVISPRILVPWPKFYWSQTLHPRNTGASRAPITRLCDHTRLHIILTVGSRWVVPLHFFVLGYRMQWFRAREGQFLVWIIGILRVCNLQKRPAILFKPSAVNRGRMQSGSFQLAQKVWPKFG